MKKPIIQIQNLGKSIKGKWWKGWRRQDHFFPFTVLCTIPGTWLVLNNVGQRKGLRKGKRERKDKMEKDRNDRKKAGRQRKSKNKIFQNIKHVTSHEAKNITNHIWTVWREHAGIKKKDSMSLRRLSPVLKLPKCL